MKRSDTNHSIQQETTAANATATENIVEPPEHSNQEGGPPGMQGTASALDVPKLRIPKLSKRKSSYMSIESIVKRISREDIRLVYTMERVLGSGNFGTARLAHKTGNM